MSALAWPHGSRDYSTGQASQEPHTFVSVFEETTGRVRPTCPQYSAGVEAWMSLSPTYLCLWVSWKRPMSSRWGRRLCSLALCGKDGPRDSRLPARYAANLDHRCLFWPRIFALPRESIGLFPRGDSEVQRCRKPHDRTDVLSVTSGLEFIGHTGS